MALYTAIGKLNTKYSIFSSIEVIAILISFFSLLFSFTWLWVVARKFRVILLRSLNTEMIKSTETEIINMNGMTMRTNKFIVDIRTVPNKLVCWQPLISSFGNELLFINILLTTRSKWKKIGMKTTQLATTTAIA